MRIMQKYFVIKMIKSIENLVNIKKIIVFCKNHVILIGMVL